MAFLVKPLVNWNKYVLLGSDSQVYCVNTVHLGISSSCRFWYILGSTSLKKFQVSVADYSRLESMVFKYRFNKSDILRVVNILFFA